MIRSHGEGNPVMEELLALDTVREDVNASHTKGAMLHSQAGYASQSEFEGVNSSSAKGAV